MRISLPHRFAACMLLAGLMAGMPAHAAAWHDDLPQAKLIGSAELSWFGLKIYSASLWSARTPFDPERPFALELTYRRSISRARIVQTSIDEIRRLSGNRYSEEQLRRWQAFMDDAFIDVSEGDQLTGVYLPGVGCRFYSGSRLLGDIADVDFAHVFFAIWLDPRSKDQQLRNRLLGMEK